MTMKTVLLATLAALALVALPLDLVAEDAAADHLCRPVPWPCCHGYDCPPLLSDLNEKVKDLLSPTLA